MRPTHLTTQLGESIAEHVTIGASLKVAAAHEGVSEDRAWAWQRKGRKAIALVESDPGAALDENQKLYADFAKSIARARAQFEINILRRLDTLDACIQMADPATGELVTINKIDPKIAAALSKSLTWLLERKRRDEYGSQITVKVEEAKTYLLDTLGRVCDRLGTQEVLGAVLDELETGGEEVAIEQGERPAVH